ncbi:hypothetical protein EXN23_24165 [Agrobacterium salinitolerans]|uniref:Histidine phosphatase family protein n=1 Tax=Agrobacterium salinitolerans TaxID=1183413 RepID=A0ABY3BM32_9HYPH|nr:hypothetical protein EXN23_24165 [Agrobacterium salinitolerans]
MSRPTIYLLRHGETVWNSLGRFQWQLDSPLTQRGIEQADHVAHLRRGCETEAGRAHTADRP